MARINKKTITLCALLFTLPYIPLTQAAEHAGSHAQKSHTSKAKHTGSSTHKEIASSKHHVSTAKSTASSKKAGSKKAGSTKKKNSAATKTAMSNLPARSKRYTKAGEKLRNSNELDILVSQLSQADNDGPITRKCLTRRGYKKPSCIKVRGGRSHVSLEDASLASVELDDDASIADVHKARVMSAKKTAMNKLMNQLGKPYRWGGTSPRTGFDCSGLIYYAYKDLVNFRIPRTANEMYHVRDAAPVGKSDLVSGDLVFFRTHSRAAADHVGVYVGNGKFIQSPRTGRDIVITSLSDDYWQRHYVGARRMMRADTIR